MKKILFGTTALLAAGAFASAAQASDPIKLQLGGYMEYWVAGAQQDSDYNKVGTNRVNNFDVQGESEIFFKGTTTLDNGMKIGVQVELEGGSNDNGTDVIDESYMWVEGKYGKLIVGSENDAAYLSHISAPEASEMGQGIGEGDTNKYLIIPITTLEPQVGVDQTGDANKLTYFTPVFYGFQGGISYTPSNSTAGDDASSVSETVTKAFTMDDSWSFVVNYGGKFSGVGVKATAAYVTSDDARGNAPTGVAKSFDAVRDVSGGLEVSYQGFTVAGSVRRLIASQNSALAAKDGLVWDAGIQYAEGPYAVSLSYLSSEVEGSTSNKGQDELDLWRIGAKYTLGPGVILFGQLAYADSTDETNVSTAGNEGAYGGVVGLKLNF